MNWQFAHEKKTECLDHDGASGDQVFSFPALADASTAAQFQISGSSTIAPSDITVYSIDTRPSGSRLALNLPGVMAQNGIISRAEWGADETIRYADAGPLKTSYANYLQYVAAPKTAAQLKAIAFDTDHVNFLQKQ